ncbi:MAG: hypothetical protein AABZ08_03200 [Planctomycetota bacterium]
MKHRAALRLIIKGVGIYVVAEQVPAFLSTVIGVFSAWAAFTGELLSEDDSFLGLLVKQFSPRFLGSAAGIALGAWLVFRCERVIERIMPLSRRYCLECGYELIGDSIDQCLECGTSNPPIESPVGNQP